MYISALNLNFYNFDNTLPKKEKEKNKKNNFQLIDFLNFFHKSSPVTEIRSITWVRQYEIYYQETNVYWSVIIKRIYLVYYAVCRRSTLDILFFHLSEIRRIYKTGEYTIRVQSVTCFCGSYTRKKMYCKKCLPLEKKLKL